MADPALAVVLGFRDREVERVERCLASLARQAFRAFEVIFVDYGSALPLAGAAQAVVERYDFCRYLYTDTRGYPWNRSQALNIGGRRTTAGFIMTTDVDMIFPPDFLGIFMQHADPPRELHVFPHLLPKGFADWDRIEEYLDRLPTATPSARGACQCIAAEVYQHLRGFDEFFRYYGMEDRDIHLRLKQLGIEEVWLTGQTHMFHQWHPRSDHLTRDFMPEGFWGRAENYLLRQRDQVVRNTDGWGRIYTAEDRPALGFLDLDAGRLVERGDLAIFDAPPASNQSISDLVARFVALPAGHVLAVTHAFYPQRTRVADRVLRYGNRWLSRRGASTRIDYARNVLHAFVVEFIEQNPALVADYYLGFPALDGVSLLVRA